MVSNVDFYKDEYVDKLKREFDELFAYSVSEEFFKLPRIAKDAIHYKLGGLATSYKNLTGCDLNE